MSEIRVPDIGDFTDVPVIEVLVSVGDEIAAEDALVTLESDKATMEIPAPSGGKVQEILVAVGDRVSEGTPIVVLEGAPADGPPPGPVAPEPAVAEPAAQAAPPAAPPAAEEPSRRAQVVVIGSGPGGYTAAFRAADLGLKTVLVERYASLGGVCLNVGCIPSKALLHAARVIEEAKEAEAFGLSFGEPEVDLDRLRAWKDKVVGQLTGGLGGLAKRRGVEVAHGEARFTSPNSIEVGGEAIGFEHCIIAAGSRAFELPGIPEDPRIVDSTGALELEGIPERLLVVGGGIIGLEMATVYEALGSRVSVVELTDQLIPGCDQDLVAPLRKRVASRYEAIMLSTRVTQVEPQDDGLRVTFQGEGAPEPQVYDRILMAVGRRPNGDRLDVAAAGVRVDERGFIPVDEQRRTNVPHIFAIGDIAGGPMLAHKATHEGVTAAEVIAGHDVAFEPRSIPSVAYTDPEIAWTGLTETEAGDTPYEKAVFPWAAAGRALSLERPEGLTKLLVDPETHRVLGAGIVGVNAGDLIAEIGLAIEMGADAEDIALTIHPHPTLSETVAFAAEVAEGTVTDIYVRPRRR